MSRFEARVRRAGLGGSAIVGLLLFARPSNEPLHEQSAFTTCTVERVADGDTISCRDGRRIRLVGIDAPELDQPPFGRQSRVALEQVIPPGTRLGVELAPDPVDAFGRTLAYLWDDRTMINELMVRRGWALAFVMRPNVRYAEALRVAEREARWQNVGHWGTGGFACRPVEHRRGTC